MAITSAFQADDAGSIPAARSSTQGVTRTDQTDLSRSVPRGMDPIFFSPVLLYTALAFCAVVD